MSESTYYKLYRTYKKKYLSLINQIGGEKKKIVIFRSNTALDVFPDDSAFREMLLRIDGIESVDFYQVSNLMDLIDKFKSYKPQQVSQFIIQAHGSYDRLIIGSDLIKLDSPLWGEFVKFIQFELIPRLATMNGSVFIHSCSIASENDGKISFARRTSQILGSTVLYGASGDVKMLDVEVIPSSVTTISYQITPSKQNSNYQIKAFTDGNDFNQQTELFKLMQTFSFDENERYKCVDQQCIPNPTGEYPDYESCIERCFD